MKLLIALLIITAALGCGKKVEDSGPQFGLNLDLTATQESAKDGVVVRGDENSGPTYALSSVTTQNIESIDKKLLCGPVTIPAKRSLKTDTGFLNFKVSEAEFHGLNQLPKHPTCNLQVTATNGTGSTVTKNIPINLNFDSGPKLQVVHYALSMGHIASPHLFDRDKMTLEGYEISNPLPYDVSIVYIPNRSAQVWGIFASTRPGADGSCSHSAVTVSKGPIIFDPVQTQVTEDINSSLRFKVKAGQTVKFTEYGLIPGGWVGNKGTSLGVFYLISLTIARVDNWDRPTLFQSADFEFSSQDLSSPDPVPVDITRGIPYVGSYVPVADPGMGLGGFIKNPDL